MNKQALTALDALIQGNQNYAKQVPSARVDPQAVSSHRQSPMAVVVGCSDSRVPPEIIFNQGLGQLFVVRVAGNVVTPTQLGSVEFAVTNFAVPLVVVLGHTHCGAVKASLSAPPDDLSPNVAAIFQHIQPVIDQLKKSQPALADEALMDAAVRANVEFNVRQLSEQSPKIKNLIDTEQLAVVGAIYDLTTGLVEFFTPTDNNSTA